jgi:hypothetical protein
MFCQTFRRFALVALCGALLLPMAQAQEDEKSDSKALLQDNVKKTIAVRVASGKHWIGVMPVPIDDALKSQLNLKDRLMVHHVIPETPAGKAGLQAHDILLKYGDKEIATVDDLMSAVNANSDKESKLTVLRGGKETTLTIKPGERPAEEKLQGLLPKHNPEDLTRFFGLKGDHGDTLIWRGLGPGVLSKTLTQGSEFPNGLSITVSKDNDKPAQIIAKKDDKTYETTADKLDILPEEIRGHVERLLRSPQIVTLNKGAEGALRYRLHAEELQKAAEEHAAKALRQHVEVRKIDGGAVGELKKEVEALRKAVEELKDAKDSKKSDESKAEKKDSD